jgi:hypothetical protein
MKGTIFLVLLALLFPLPTFSQHFISPRESFPTEAPHLRRSLNTNQTTRVLWHRNKVDMGYLRVGETRSETIQFSNSGNAPLDIIVINSTCPELKSTYPEDPILPGQKSEITLSVTAQSRRALTCFITVRSNSRSFADILTMIGIPY